MSTMVLPMASPKSLKRPFDDMTMPEGFQEEPQATPSSPSKPPSHQPQLAPSTSNLNQSPRPSESSKKPKLSFAEKEAQRVEKESKEKLRAEERAKKEQEKAQREKEKAAREEERLKKAEEKKQKEEERKKIKEEKEEERKKIKEERDRAKEEEKIKKEEDKQKKTEEKEKKERSQLRLSSFFLQAAGIDRSPTLSPHPTPSASRRGSLAEIKVEDLGSRSRSVSAAPVQQLSDFQRAFPEFYIHPHVTLAPSNQFGRDEVALLHAQSSLDENIFGNGGKDFNTHSMLSFHDRLRLPPRKKQRRIPPQVSVKSVIAQIDGAAQNPIDLTGTKKSSTDPAEALKLIPVKSIKFYQDVRPPYKGTYTKITCPKQIRRLARNPFFRYRPDTDYDYDSEAEWEEPEEGEELVSEDEEEPEEDEDDDIQDWLDNEEVPERRRPLLGNLEPSCTGILWADESNEGPDLSQFRIDMLTDTPIFPIDPYNSDYWPKPAPPPPPAPRWQPAPEPTIDELIPALRPSNVSTLINRKISLGTPQDSNTTQIKPPPKLIPQSLLPEFKAAVENSDCTKAVLVDLLKRRFSTFPKSVLSDSLDAVAERIGNSLKTRRWVIRPGV